MDHTEEDFKIPKAIKHGIYRKILDRLSNDDQEVPLSQGPADVGDVVCLLRDGLGFRVKYVDHSKDPSEPEVPGCRVVARCCSSGLRVILDLPHEQCTCTHNYSDVYTWNVSSSTDSLHEMRCTAFPEVSIEISRTVREMVDMLRKVVTELEGIKLNTCVSVESLQTLRVTAPSDMRRSGSAPTLSGDNVACSSHSMQDLPLGIISNSQMPGISNGCAVEFTSIDCKKCEQFNINSSEPVEMLQRVNVIKNELQAIENLLKSSSCCMVEQNGGNTQESAAASTKGSTSIPRKTAFLRRKNPAAASTEVRPSRTTLKVKKSFPIVTPLIAAKKPFSEKAGPSGKTSRVSQKRPIVGKKLPVPTTSVQQPSVVSSLTSVKKPPVYTKSRIQVLEVAGSLQRTVISSRRKVRPQNQNETENSSESQ